MKQFNLIKALDGDDMCTVDGRSARLTTLRTATHKRRLVVLVNGIAEDYTVHGLYNLDGTPSAMDLKMK